MSAGEIHLGDVGTKIGGYIKEDGVIVDIQTANPKQIKFTKPSGASVTKSGVFITDGTDGGLMYVTEANFLDELGDWQFQCYATLGTWTGHSDIHSFEVEENLAGS